MGKVLDNAFKIERSISTDDIIAYESGELDEEQTIELFQKLINSGLAWQLQGHYGRTAKALINAGLCTQA